jgi:hypothetical protein
MRKLITLTLAVLMVGLFAAVVFAAVEAGNDPSSTVGTTVDTTETTETTTTDETRDISGPCDEAEHANDPRCTGALAPRVEDGDDHRRGGDEFEDHSGPGRGGDDFDDDDHSGSGRGGGDDFDDDHSGPGGGGDDDDSGHGGDDD